MAETHSINMPQFRVTSSVTVFVAVSNVLAGPLFMVAPTTNSEHFIEFLQLIQLYRTDQPNQKPLFTVLDGHPSHHCN